MRKIKLYIAASLNNKIAKLDGDVSWLENLPNPDQTDYGFQEFFNSIDTTIQGYKTYKQVKDWGIPDPYREKNNYVISTQERDGELEGYSFIHNNHVEKILEIKQRGGKDIWLIGGGQTITFMLKNKLVDEIKLFIMPIILENGLDLFAGIPPELTLKLTNCTTYSSGAIEVAYTL